MTDSPSLPDLDEATATRLVTEALDAIGGPHTVYRNPRMAFARNATRMVEHEGYRIEIRYGEISSPAIVTIQRYVFEIHDDEVELLMTLPPRRP